MTTPFDLDPHDLAAPYALHAMSDAERDEIDARLALDPQAAHTFYGEVRAVREAMAALSAVTAVAPPAQLRRRVLEVTSAAATSPPPAGRNWRPAILAAAAAVVIGAGAAIGIGMASRPEPQPSTAQQVFAAPDVRTVSGTLPTGGTATLVFSHARDAGVLVMNNVPPPTQGSVYQMWLIGHDGPTSAGTMDAKAVAPSTTAVLPDLGDSTELAFTVEPGTGSVKPTGAVFARLSLT